jgi:hypothetical protein
MVAYLKKTGTALLNSTHKIAKTLRKHIVFFCRVSKIGYVQELEFVEGAGMVLDGLSCHTDLGFHRFSVVCGFMIAV